MQKKQPNEEKAAGLYIIGIISARSKRQVPKDNPQHEVVTYLIKSETGRNCPSDFLYIYKRYFELCAL